MIQYDSINSSAQTNNTITVGQSSLTDYYTYPSVWWQGTTWPITTYHYCLHDHAHNCDTKNHDFLQAQAPYDGVLFCRHCGKTKELKK